MQHCWGLQRCRYQASSILEEHVAQFGSLWFSDIWCSRLQLLLSSFITNNWSARRWPSGKLTLSTWPWPDRAEAQWQYEVRACCPACGGRIAENAPKWQSTSSRLGWADMNMNSSKNSTGSRRKRCAKKRERIKVRPQQQGQYREAEWDYNSHEPCYR